MTKKFKDGDWLWSLQERKGTDHDLEATAAERIDIVEEGKFWLNSVIPHQIHHIHHLQEVPVRVLPLVLQNRPLQWVTLTAIIRKKPK